MSFRSFETLLCINELSKSCFCYLSEYFLKIYQINLNMFSL